MRRSPGEARSQHILVQLCAIAGVGMYGKRSNSCDDSVYIVPPFDSLQMLARLRAVIRRSRLRQFSVELGGVQRKSYMGDLCFGNFILDS
jgi:hypothetical protein